MVKGVFCVFDSKSSIFANPFTSVNNLTATRDFTRAANDPNSELCQYPDDFFLYKVGEYDDNSGLITPVQLTNLGSAASFKEA